MTLRIASASDRSFALRSTRLTRASLGLTEAGRAALIAGLRAAARAQRAANVEGMDQRTLARTGVPVTPLVLGAMMFGAWGETDHDECVRIIHRALDAGINFIDTADVYARGESEEIVGKALAGGRRDNVVLATKFHGPMGDDPNEAGNSRRWIFREVEASLKRLKTDWIDLYQIHPPEAENHIDETR